MFKLFLTGFSINFFTSVDDVLTNIPVLSASARTNKGRIAFALGNLIAVTVVALMAYTLSRFLVLLPYSNIIVASLIFIMAIIVYFNLLAFKQPKMISKDIEKSTISSQHFTKLVVLGFFMTFTTMLDDMLALAPLFLGSVRESIMALMGIYAASLLLIFGTIYFAKQIETLPYKKELATAALVIFGFLLLFGIV